MAHKRGYARIARENDERRQQLARDSVPRPVTTVRLSQVLHNFPSSFSGSKITAVGKGLSVIDELPPSYDFLAKADVLYLSSNNLRSLRGVAQFGRLKTLSVGDNLLATFDDLDPLRELPALRTLNLEGNPVTFLPNYRLHALHRLPRLTELDKKPVRAGERREAAAVLKTEAVCMQRLFRNQ